MRMFTKEIFNQVMYGTNEYYSAAETFPLLGAAEKLVLQGLVVQASGTSPSLTVKVYISNDGQNWALKTTLGPQSLTTSTLNSFMLVDSGSSLSGSQVRLGFALASSDNVANVRVIACGRGEQPGI